MPKIILLLSLAAAFFAQSPPAQSPAPSADWQRYTRPGEEFTVELPAGPSAYSTTREVKDSVSDEKESARVYSAYQDGVVFVVALFDNPRPHESLDFFVDGFFGGLGLPPVDGTFRKNVRSGKVGGWEYALTYEDLKGVARLFLTPKHAYMVGAVGGDTSHPAVGRFLNSFELSPSAADGRRGNEPAPSSWPPTLYVDPELVRAAKPLPASNPPQGSPTPGRNVGGGIGPGEGVGVGMGSGVGPGRGAPAAVGPAAPPPDGDGPFTVRQVTKKAVPVLKPEPGYTEEARRNNVTGVVRLRCVFSSDGSVSRLSIIKALPDGLSQRAAAAAQLIRFLPALKDGRRVSQYVVIEYNFDIY